MATAILLGSIAFVAIVAFAFTARCNRCKSVVFWKEITPYMHGYHCFYCNSPVGDAYTRVYNFQF